MTSWKRVTVLAWSIAFVGVVGAASVQPQGGETLTPEDYAEIHQLYARYAHTLDSGDADGWARTFTSDGVFANAQGYDGLVGFATNFHEQQSGHARHWNSQVMITPSAEGANGACYLFLYDTGVRPPSVIAAGIYRDTLVKTANGWRFKTRAVEIDRPAEGGQ